MTLVVGNIQKLSEERDKLIDGVKPPHGPNKVAFVHLAALHHKSDELIAALQSELTALRKKLEVAEGERDLAIAHDLQPYPTQWAYDQACAALNKHKESETALRAELVRVKGESVRVDVLRRWERMKYDKTWESMPPCLYSDPDISQSVLEALEGLLERRAARQ